MIHEERSVIWGGVDRIGHCKKLGSYEPVSHSEKFPRDRWMNLQIQNNCEW